MQRKDRAGRRLWHLFPKEWTSVNCVMRGTNSSVRKFEIWRQYGYLVQLSFKTAGSQGDIMPEELLFEHTSKNVREVISSFVCRMNFDVINVYFRIDWAYYSKQLRLLQRWCERVKTVLSSWSSQHDFLESCCFSLHQDGMSTHTHITTTHSLIFKLHYCFWLLIAATFIINNIIAKHDTE